MQIFADNIRRRADELKLTLAEVARRAGLSERRFGNYVTNEREPDLATLVKIAKALQTTPDRLLGVDRPGAAPSVQHLQWERLKAAAEHLSEVELEILIQQTAIAVELRRGSAANESN
jgi:transcriptional regulator with XRE-family HTH domain